MIKVAIFCDNLNVGGIQKSLINLLNNFNINKYNIDLFLFEKNNFFQNKIPSNINVIYLDKFPFITKFMYFNIVKSIFKNKFNFNDYDVAIDFDSYQNYTALGAISTNAKRKIMWIHNDVVEKRKSEIKYRILHYFFKSKYKYFDEFVGVSKGVIEPFKKLNKINGAKFTVIPNYIDTNEILNSCHEKINFDVDSNTYNIVSVGRLCHQKGFDILISEIERLLEYRSDFHLYIIGDGNEKKKLTKIVNEKNLNSYITFLGNQKNPFVYMNKMDAFVLMSRYEGQGMVILEAKTLGLNIFIPKHLEKYVEDIKGYDDPIYELSKATKKEKIKDKLDDYNNNIIASFERLLGGKND